MNSADKYIKISITGDLGSGKSTVCHYLKEKFGLNVYSIGLIQRALAQKYNMDIYSFNKYMESHTEIDEEIDTELARIGKRNENMVLDSRMAWHFVPDSFKVYLAVQLDEAVKRIMKACRGNVESYDSVDEAKSKIVARKNSENTRYINKYGVDCSNYGNYDLILDTTLLSPEQVAREIMSHIK